MFDSIGCYLIWIDQNMDLWHKKLDGERNYPFIGAQNFWKKGQHSHSIWESWYQMNDLSKNLTFFSVYKEHYG